MLLDQKNAPIDNALPPDVNAKRNSKKSMALQVQCPFQLKWSLIGYKRSYKMNFSTKKLNSRPAPEISVNALG